MVGLTNKIGIIFGTVLENIGSYVKFIGDIIESAGQSIIKASGGQITEVKTTPLTSRSRHFQCRNID